MIVLRKSIPAVIFSIKLFSMFNDIGDCDKLSGFLVLESHRRRYLRV